MELSAWPHRAEKQVGSIGIGTDNTQVPDAISTPHGAGILVFRLSPCGEMVSTFWANWNQKSQGVPPTEPFLPSQTVEHGFPNQPSALAFDPELRIMAIGTRSGAVKMYPLLPRCSGIVRTSHVPLTFGWDRSVTGTSWRQQCSLGLLKRLLCLCACDDSFQKGEGLFVGRWVIAGRSVCSEDSCPSLAVFKPAGS